VTAASTLLKKLLGTDDTQLSEEIESLKSERREWERGLGMPAHVAHERVDELIVKATETFAWFFEDGGRRIPDELHHEFTPRLVAAFQLSSPEFATRAHAAVDAATREGVYSPISASEIEDKRVSFSKQIEAREIALRRREQATRAAAEAEALAALDAEAEAVLSK
jgi:hypothetical protein